MNINEKAAQLFGERLGDVEVQQAQTRQAVINNSKSLVRIEERLEKPTGQPSWVAISGLLATVVSLMAAVVLAFVNTTLDPLAGEISDIKQGMVFDNSREESEVARLAIAESRVDRLESDVESTFRYLSRMAEVDNQVLRASEAELQRRLDSAHSEAHGTHQKIGSH